MNFNSPMMQRVTRGRGGFALPFSVPRKGRIRIALLLVLIAVLVRFFPAMVKKIHLPVLKFPAKHAIEKKLLKKPDGKRPPRRLSDVALQLASVPTALGAMHVVPLSGHDSAIVYTSIDTLLKKHVDDLMVRYNPLYGALVALDPVTGRILSLVSYTNDSMPDCGANLCLKSTFPAASTFKTITAAAAIEYEEFTSGCMLEHRGRTSTLYRSQIARELDWTVDISLVQAFARSVNAVFARIGIYEVGKDRLLAMADSFGFNQPLPGDLQCGVSRAVCTDSLFDIAEFASGFNQHTTISPLHGALIAAAIARDGSMPVPTLVDSILDKAGRVKKFGRTDGIWRQTMQKRTAQELQQLMKAVPVIGTARKQFRDMKNSERFNDFIYGGKTGSVDKDSIGRVDWFIGFAMHPERSDEQIAVGVLTVHGAFWTVHSSYLAAEAMRFYLRSVQERKRKSVAVDKLVQTGDSVSSTVQ